MKITRLNLSLVSKLKVLRDNGFYKQGISIITMKEIRKEFTVNHRYVRFFPRCFWTTVIKTQMCIKSIILTFSFHMFNIGD